MIFKYEDMTVQFISVNLNNQISNFVFDETVGDLDDEYASQIIIQQKSFVENVKTVLLFNSGDNPIASYIQILESIYFLLGKYVCKWNVLTACIEWRVSLDASACFSIQLMPNKKEILVWGESQLTKIDLEGNIIWVYFSADILVTKTGEGGPEIDFNEIHIIDWNNIRHVLDFNGNVLPYKTK